MVNKPNGYRPTSFNDKNKRSKQLPTKEEMEIALETLLEYKLKDKSEYDKITFSFGFRTCYLWLANRNKK